MVIMPAALAQAIIGDVFERRLDRAESGLGQPNALGGNLAEIGFRQAGFENDRAAMHAHAAGTEILESFCTRPLPAL